MAESLLLDPRQKRVRACKEGCSVALSVLKAWWKLLVLVLTPFVLLPLPLALSPASDDQVRVVMYIELISIGPHSLMRQILGLTFRWTPWARWLYHSFRHSTPDRAGRPAFISRKLFTLYTYTRRKRISWHTSKWIGTQQYNS